MRDFDPDVIVLVETRISNHKADIVVRSIRLPTLIKWRLEASQEVFGFCGKMVSKLKWFLTISNLFI